LFDNVEMLTVGTSRANYFNANMFLSTEETHSY